MLIRLSDSTGYSVSDQADQINDPGACRINEKRQEKASVLGLTGFLRWCYRTVLLPVLLIDDPHDNENEECQLHAEKAVEEELQLQSAEHDAAERQLDSLYKKPSGRQTEDKVHLKNLFQR